MDRTNQLNGNYKDYAKIEKLRNFEPKVFNENTNNFVDVLNATDQYWDGGSKPMAKVRNVVKMRIDHVAKVDRFIITKQEYVAIKKIVRAMRAYLFRMKVMRRIKNKKYLQNAKMRFKEMIIKDTLNPRQKPKKDVKVSPKSVEAKGKKKAGVGR